MRVERGRGESVWKRECAYDRECMCVKKEKMCGEEKVFVKKRRCIDRDMEREREREREEITERVQFIRLA